MTDTTNPSEGDRAADRKASPDPSVVDQTPTAGLTQSELPELVGWQPDFQPVPERTNSKKEDGLTDGLTDAEILASYRHRYPYIALGTAKECYRTWLKFRHLGAAKKKAEEQERQEADRRLRALLKERRG